MMQALRQKTILNQMEAKQLMSQPWVVYCKQPFFGAQQVVEYLGRYTHKIAISNHRIKTIDENTITFSAKDYRKGGKKYRLTLPHSEFIRRFALHILPKAFVRIRHYGILSSAIKLKVRNVVELQIGKARIPIRPPIKHHLCYTCGKGQLITILTFDARGPPPLELLPYFTLK